MNTSPTQAAATPPVASSTPTPLTGAAKEASIGARIDAFNADVERSLKEAEHGISDLFHRRRHTGQAGGIATTPSLSAAPAPQAPTLSPVTESTSPSVPALPSPALPAIDATQDLPEAVLVPAQSPRIALSLSAIAEDLQALVQANGGELKMAEQGLQIIAGALNDPAAEAGVVLADLGKIITQLVQSFLKPAAPAQTPAPEAAPEAEAEPKVS